MIWDSHVHLKHGDAARTEYSAETIVRAMDAAGVEKSVVFAMSTTTRHSIDMAEDAVAQFPDRLIPYAYALPSYERPVIQELEEALTQRGFRGIKIHAGECTLADYVVDPVLTLAGRCGVSCLIDLAGNQGIAESLAGRFPQTKIIIAHLGRYRCADEDLIDGFIALAARRANLYLDVSGVVLLHKIRDAIERVGSKRVTWGSDGPVQAPDTATYLKLELDKIRGLKLEPQVEHDLLGGSLKALLAL